MTDTDTTYQTLKDAVAENDFKKFNNAYMAFLKQYDGFEDSFSQGPSGAKVINPIFGHRVFSLNNTDNEQADDLLAKGRAASKVFGKLSLEDRKSFLSILEKKIAQNEKEIALTIIADTGKPVDLSAKEMGKGAEWFTYAREEMDAQLGPRKLKHGRMELTKPLGVAQVISAYNYPYALAVGGIVGALAGGNGTIVSAPLKAPNWVFPFKKAADEAVAQFTSEAQAQGKLTAKDAEILKDGLIQNSLGVNKHLTAEADVVHFVGSDGVGKSIAGDRGLKPTILEMGGGNVVTVMNSAFDAPQKDKKTGSDIAGTKQDAQYIAQTIFDGFGPATGQRCTAPRVVCVQEGSESVTDELMRLCREGMGGGDIGNPFEKGVKMGPLVDRLLDNSAHQKMQKAIAMAKAAGAEVSNDMKIDPEFAKRNNMNLPQLAEEESYWVRPVAIDLRKVKDEQALEKIHKWVSENEIFGPLVWITKPVKNLEEAVAVTNKLDTHKLAGAIFTSKQSDVDTYHEETRVKSLEHNLAPKDQSPDGPHGHSGGISAIGGRGHFGQYVDAFAQRPVQGEAVAR